MPNKLIEDLRSLMVPVVSRDVRMEAANRIEELEKRVEDLEALVLRWQWSDSNFYEEATLILTDQILESIKE